MLRAIQRCIYKKIVLRTPLSIEFMETFPKQALRLAEKIDIFMLTWGFDNYNNFPKFFLEEIQHARLKKILIHAKNNVLYWKEIFKESNFEPHTFRDANDLRKIPIVTRRQLNIISHSDLFATNISKKRFVKYATSGSTAEPLKFFQDAQALFLRKAGVHYELQYGGAYEGQILVIGLQQLRHVSGLGYQINAYRLEDAEWRQNIFYHRLSALKPRLILATPSYLKRFVFFIQRDGFSLKNSIESIRYFGEYLGEDERKKIEEFFGCPIYGIYGSQENSLIAIECNNHNYHIIPWMNYVEIVDDDGKLLPKGKEGNIVVTSFENEVMPFIRYKIGDRGRLLEEKCGCGQNTPLLEFRGRIVGNIEFADGSAFPMFYVLHHIADNYSSQIKQFQVEQAAYHTLIFRYVPSLSDEGCLGVEEKLRKYFQSFVQDRMNIVIERSEYILPNESGKTPIFIKNL